MSSQAKDAFEAFSLSLMFEDAHPDVRRRIRRASVERNEIENRHVINVEFMNGAVYKAPLDEILTDKHMGMMLMVSEAEKK